MRPPNLHRRNDYPRRDARVPVLDVVIITNECLDISFDEAVSRRLHVVAARDKSTGLILALHLGIWSSSGAEVLKLFGDHVQASAAGTLGAIRVCRDTPATFVVDDGLGFHDAAFNAAALKMGVTVVHAPGSVDRGPAASLARWLRSGSHNIDTPRDLRSVVDAWLAHLDHAHRDADGLARS